MSEGIDIYINADGSEWSRQGRKLLQSLKPNKLKKIIKTAGDPFVQRAKQNAPVADQMVRRYSGGQVVARYFPGNLERSFRALTGKLRKKKDGVVFGPLRGKNPRGNFRGNKVDGWYGHFAEYGTKHQTADPWVDPAWDATQGVVLRNIIHGARAQINGVS